MSLISGIKISNSEAAPTHTDNGLDLHSENENIVTPRNGVPPFNSDGPPTIDPVAVKFWASTTKIASARGVHSIYRFDFDPYR